MIDLVKSSERCSVATLCSTTCRVPRSFCASAWASKPRLFRWVSANGCLRLVSTVGSWLLWRRRRRPPSSCRRRRRRHQLSAGTPLRLAAGLPPWREALARQRRWMSRSLWHATGRRARPLTLGRHGIDVDRLRENSEGFELDGCGLVLAIWTLHPGIVGARWRQRRWALWRQRR